MTRARKERRRRGAVAAGVVAAHVLVLFLALTAHLERRAEDAAPVVLTTFFELPAAARSVDLQEAPATRPQLQDFAPAMQDLPEPQLIELPEAVAPLVPVGEIPPAGTGPLAEPAGAATGTGGQSGGGNALLLLQRVLPDYPRAAARRGERGITQVLLHVTPSGRVDQVKVERGSGSKLLDDAAVAAFRKWRFQPLPAADVAGRWLRTAQRFILYQFTWSLLDADAMDYVYSENLKPKAGAIDEATPGSREALLRFLARVRSPDFDARGGVSRRELTELRENLGKWGEVRSVVFTGVVGSSRWLRHGTRTPGRTGGSVEVSWNGFEVQHAAGKSEWIIAMDHNGEVWAAQMGHPPE